MPRIGGREYDFQQPFVDFSGGRNSDASTYTLRDDEHPSGKNVRTDPLGPISGRLGVERKNGTAGYNESDFGAAPAAINKPIRSLHRYYRQDASHSLLFTLNNRLGKITSLATPGTVVNVPPVGGAPTAPAFTGSQVDQAWETLTTRDWAYFTTQQSVPLRTDGSFVYVVGESPAGGENPTLLAVAGTSHTPGNYYYVVTRVYRDGLGESPISGEVLINIAAGPNQSVQVTIAGTTHPDVIAYNVYRTLSRAVATGGGPYYFVGQVAINPPVPPVVLTDTVADNALGSRVDTTRVSPPKAAFAADHQGRLWLGRLIEGSTNRFFYLAFSDSNKPDQFPVDFQLIQSNPSGEPLTGMFAYEGQLYLTTMNYLFAVVGTGREQGSRINIPDYRIDLVARGPGAMSHRTIQQRDGRVFMTNKSDIWIMEGNQIRPLTQFRLRKFLKTNLDRTLASRAIAAITDRDYRVSFPKQGGTGFPEVTVLYDYQSNAFLVDDGYTLASYAFLDGEADNLELWAGEANDRSYLYRVESGNQDWDPLAAAYKNVTRNFRTKDWSFGRRIAESCRHELLLIEGLNTQSTVQPKFHINKDRFSAVLPTVRFQPEGPLWGQFVWGDAPWGIAGQVTKHLSLPETAIGERIAIELEQNANEAPFTVELVAIAGTWKGFRPQSYGGG